MFANSSNVLINDGVFTSNVYASHGKNGFNILREQIAAGAFHNSFERYNSPKCHPHTRMAVIQAIINWIEDGQKTTFIHWLYGPAGAGKSALAQTIAEKCHQAGILAASFFWSRSAHGRNNEDRLIATLAYQLILAVPEMRPHVEQALEHDPSLLSRSLEAQIYALILQPLEKAFLQEGSGYTGAQKLIIFDGLDECGTPKAQEYIVKVFANFAAKSSIPFKFLISSRPEQVIRGLFNTQPLLAFTTRLALDDMYRPDDDIRIFFVDSFESGN